MWTILLSILFFVSWLVAIPIAIAIWIKKSHEKKLETYTYETEAIISDFVKKDKYYFPVFEYDYWGRHIQKQSNIGLSSQTYHVGDSMKIKVNPENPEQYVIQDDKLVKFGYSVNLGIAGFIWFSLMLPFIIIVLFELLDELEAILLNRG